MVVFSKWKAPFESRSAEAPNLRLFGLTQKHRKTKIPARSEKKGIPMSDVSKKKFNVKLCLKVTELKDGQETAFFDTSVGYSDIGYDGVIAVESILLGALAQLNDAGYNAALACGLEEKLSMMGVSSEKLAALKASR